MDRLQADKIKRGLTALEADPPSLDRSRMSARIARLFLGHRDLRFAGDWACAPEARRWLDRFARKCRPSPRPRWRLVRSSSDAPPRSGLREASTFCFSGDGFRYSLPPASGMTGEFLMPPFETLCPVARGIGAGITQIIAWGTIFYSLVLTAPLIMRRPAGRCPSSWAAFRWAC
jgi:hypothetical protein